MAARSPPARARRAALLLACACLSPAAAFQIDQSQSQTTLSKDVFLALRRTLCARPAAPIASTARPLSHHTRAQSGRSARNSARASNSPALRRHACTLHHRRFQFAIVLAVGLLLTFVFYYRHTSAQRREAELEAQKRSRRLAAKAAAAANGGGGGAAAAAGAAANGAAANGAAKPSTPAAAKSPTKSKKAKKSD